MNSISATDLARKTRQILDQVIARQQAVAIERHHVVVARIIPDAPRMTAAQALARLPIMLAPKAAAGWLKDSKHRFDETLSDPWE